MRVKFFTKTKTKNSTNIYVRFWHGREFDKTIKTGLFTMPQDFNNTKGRLRQRAGIKDKDLINKTLDDLEGFLLEQWNADTINKTHIPPEWLKNVVARFFGRVVDNKEYKVYFVAWVGKYIEESPKRLHRGKPLSKRTIQHYKTTESKLKAFEDYKNIRLRFEDIDLKFYRDFVHYLREVERLNNNTIGGFITNLKMWCKNIEIEGLPINPQYKHSDFMALSNKTKDIYLNEEEINRIYTHDFTGHIALTNARDLFIIGLRTGLRVSDFLRLKDVNINGDFIQVETAKTGEDVIIPLHPQVKETINRLGGVLPRSISEQKFNVYIKEICKMVGIDEMTEGAKMNPETKRKENGVFPKYELVSSHICRRSFATNLYGKLPNLTIMAITGHRNENVFLNYIKTTKKEKAQILQKYWAGEKPETISPLRIAK